MSNIVKQPCDAGVINGKPCSTSCSRITERWVLVATILGSSMAMIDSTVVNIALPVLQEDFNATAPQVQWVIESYALFVSALILLGGSLGDKFGRRFIYACGIALFAFASAWCALSPNINQLIIARGFQGIGAALLIPGSLAIISASFSDCEREKAIGTWFGFTAIISALVTVLCGWLIDNLSWRWIFFINVPFSMIILSILFHSVPESRYKQIFNIFNISGYREFIRIDYWGAMLVTLGLGMVIFGLIESSNLGLFHPSIIACLFLGILVLVAFLFLEGNIYAPMMPLSLFKSRTFSGANLLTILLYSALAGVLYFLPFNLIQIQSYSPTATSAVFLLFILIMFFLWQWSGNLVNRYGVKLPLMVGPLILAVAFILFAVPGISTSFWITFFPGIILLGFGMSISVAPLAKTVINSVRHRQTGIASAINNTVSRTAGLFAIAIFNIFVFNFFNYSLDRRLAKLNLPVQVQQALTKQRINLAAANIPDNINSKLKNALEQAITLSYIDSFRLVIFIATALALASAVIALLMIDKRQKSV